MHEDDTTPQPVFDGHESRMLPHRQRSAEWRRVAAERTVCKTIHPGWRTVWSQTRRSFDGRPRQGRVRILNAPITRPPIETGGAGSRTRVPKRVQHGVYRLSSSFITARQTPTNRVRYREGRSKSRSWVLRRRPSEPARLDDLPPVRLGRADGGRSGLGRQCEVVVRSQTFARCLRGLLATSACNQCLSASGRNRFAPIEVTAFNCGPLGERQVSRALYRRSDVWGGLSVEWLGAAEKEVGRTTGVSTSQRGD